MKKEKSYYIEYLHDKAKELSNTIDIFIKSFIYDFFNCDIDKAIQELELLEAYIQLEHNINDNTNPLVSTMSYLINNNIGKPNEIKKIFSYLMTTVKLSLTYIDLKNKIKSMDSDSITEEQFDKLGIHSLRFIESILSNEIVCYYEKIPKLYSILEQESNVETIDSILESCSI